MKLGKRLRRTALAVVIPSVAVAVIGAWNSGVIPDALGNIQASSTGVQTQAPQAPSNPGSQVGVDGLLVRGKGPMTGYDRSRFGQRWTDAVDVEGGRNGCDTRNDILVRDLTNVTFKPGTRGCVVLTGTLHEPYTNRTIEFVRGSKTSSIIQIDHVVSLGNAWESGAARMDARTRTNLANDPLNLLAADGPANQAKGKKDASGWLPANKAFRCRYVTLQVQVKAKYNLSITPPEKAAIIRELQRC